MVAKKRNVLCQRLRFPSPPISTDPRQSSLNPLCLRLSSILELAFSPEQIKLASQTIARPEMNYSSPEGQGSPGAT